NVMQVKILSSSRVTHVNPLKVDAIKLKDTTSHFPEEHAILKTAKAVVLEHNGRTNVLAEPSNKRWHTELGNQKSRHSGEGWRGF
ncbi:hypothetical protein RAO23_07955, partial [Lacticaseibacillus paracasei]|uniref:hypothetical protein n=2 Tax=Lacticaseibacillus paracasei TaxID=1597 RepID=UPI002F26443B